VNFARRILRWVEDSKSFSLLIEKIYSTTYFLKFEGINNRSDFVLSLTTTQERFNRTWVTLESLLRQNLKANKIILWLDFDIDKNKLRKIQKSQLKRGVEFRKVEDIGPHTKYYYAFQEYKNFKIITVDDDVIYPPTLTKDLINLNKKHADSICCTNAMIIERKMGHLTSYNSWSILRNWKSEDKRMDLIPLGVQGVIYNPMFFSNKTYDEHEIRSKCFKADDIWLRMQSISNNIPVVRSKKYNYKFPIVSSTQIVALQYENVGESKNDVYLNEFKDVFLNVSSEV
jgi:hypothetical protein